MRHFDQTEDDLQIPRNGPPFPYQGVHGVFSLILVLCGRRGGLMISALDSGSSGPGSGPGRGHCVVFLGKTLYSHGASLHPGV